MAGVTDLKCDNIISNIFFSPDLSVYPDISFDSRPNINDSEIENTVGRKRVDRAS